MDETDLLFGAEKRTLQILRCFSSTLTCIIIGSLAYISVYPPVYYEMQEELLALTYSWQYVYSFVLQ